MFKRSEFVYIKTYVQIYPIDSFIGDEEPRINPMDDVVADIFMASVRATLTLIQQQMVDKLLEGYNWFQAGKLCGLNTSQTYKIKKELKVKLEWVRQS